MSSHREAPEISQDPVADSTDVYAFVSPDRPGTVTLIANYIPLQGPAGGPNFYAFGDGVLYEIHVDNNGDAEADVTYQFLFQTELADKDTFLYNTGPIESLGSKNWNRRQTYLVKRVEHNKTTVLASGLVCPPCNIGPLSTPDYAGLAHAAVHTLSGGIKVFAGQRAEGFYVDLGAIFDLADLRPFQNLHAQYGMHIFSKPAPGVNATAQLNVHSIAIQVPIDDLLWGSPHGKESEKGSVIGVWTTASRQRVSVWDEDTSAECPVRPVPPGVPPRQPAGQRGADPAGPEGLLERAAAAPGQAVCRPDHPSGARRPASRALPGRLPEPGQARPRQDAARGP